MPLPPLADNLTVRVWLKYTSMGQEHDLCFRQPALTSDVDVSANAVDLANALKTIMLSTDAFTGLRASAAGSTVSFPLAWTSIAGTLGTSVEADDAAKFVAISGRSSVGYRCRLTFFTPVPGDTIGYRQNRASANYADVLLDAVEAAEPALVALNGGVVIWNQYANFGYNAYWQRQLRDS